MDEHKWREQARRAKSWNTGIFLLFAVAAAALLISFGLFMQSRRFTTEK